MRELTIRDIAIINGRAKLMRISNKLGVSKLRDQLYNILKELLGDDRDNEELQDFQSLTNGKQLSDKKLIRMPM